MRSFLLVLALFLLSILISTMGYRYELMILCAFVAGVIMDVLVFIFFELAMLSIYYKIMRKGAIVMDTDPHKIRMAIVITIIAAVTMIGLLYTVGLPGHTFSRWFIESLKEAMTVIGTGV